MKRFSIAVLAVSLVLLTGTAAQADSSGGGSQKFGPFPSSSPDGGTCGTSWAMDTFDRSFTVHDNGDGTFKLTEDFRDGTFTTNGAASPGACETSGNHGTTVNSGIVGEFQGFLSGTVTSVIFNPQGCAGGTGTQCATLAGFLLAVFGSAETFTCSLGFAGCDFNFEYHSSDQSLQFHHWQDKSDNHGGEQFVGDIANQ